MTSRQEQHMITRAPVRMPALLATRLQEIACAWPVELACGHEQGFLHVLAGSEGVTVDNSITSARTCPNPGCKGMDALTSQH